MMDGNGARPKDILKMLASSYSIHPFWVMKPNSSSCVALMMFISIPSISPYGK